MVSRITPLTNVHVHVPRACDYVMLPDKGESRLQMELSF